MHGILIPSCYRYGPAETSGVFIRVSSIGPLSSLREPAVEIDELVHVPRRPRIVRARFFCVGLLELLRVSFDCSLFPVPFYDGENVIRLQVGRRGFEMFDDCCFTFSEVEVAEDSPPLLDMRFGNPAVVH